MSITFRHERRVAIHDHLHERRPVRLHRVHRQLEGAVVDLVLRRQRHPFARGHASPLSSGSHTSRRACASVPRPSPGLDWACTAAAPPITHAATVNIVTILFIRTLPAPMALALEGHHRQVAWARR